MSVLDRLRGGTVAAMLDEADEPADVVELRQQVESLQLAVEESLAELEREDIGWAALGTLAQQDLTRAQLQTVAARARLYWLANPLIQRAVNVRMFYTWGQGVEITAPDENVNAVVQAFLDDPGNQAALFGHQAREQKDRALQLDGNLMLALFTNPRTGRVQIRTIPWAEITQIITNPEDAQERWFYVREWTETTLDPVEGKTTTQHRRALYPDLEYRPRQRARRMGERDVMWDSPILHVRSGGLDGMQWGVSEVYAALPWAKAYRDFLTDWANIAKALAKYVWRVKGPANRVQALRQAAEAERPAGQAFVGDGTIDVNAINTASALPDADRGKALAMMVGAAMDLPYTILLGDADMGNLATAKTLDRPTELAMTSRREGWAAVIRSLCDYAIDQAVLAPQGTLRGKLRRDEWDRLVIELADEADRNVDVQWPSILEHDTQALVEAIVAADSTGRVPPEVICRLLLLALEVENVDDVLAGLFDADGNFIDPAAAAQASAGQAAVDAFRRGEDAAALLR